MLDGPKDCVYTSLYFRTVGYSIDIWYYQMFGGLLEWCRWLERSEWGAAAAATGPIRLHQSVSMFILIKLLPRSY